MAVGHLPQRISKNPASFIINRPEASSTHVPLNANFESITNDRTEGEEDGAGDDDGGGEDEDEDEDEEGEMIEGDMDNEEGTEPTDADIVMYGY
ncbi:hypothetical protein H1R20_g11198, partial [Candolleomyces eurysporus]